MKVILASTSPRRKELMQKLGIEFEIIPSDFDEESVHIRNPKNMVKRLALEKALAVMKNFDEDVSIIGSDTVVVFGKKILGKPKDKEDAINMLRALSNSKHYVYTGLCVMTKRNNVLTMNSKVSKSTVRFGIIPDSEILKYVASGEPLDKAGAYAIQGNAGKFVRSIKGNLDSIIGLPTYYLYSILSDQNITKKSVKD